MRLLAIVSAVLIPIAAASGQKPAMKITGADRSHWSFVPLRKVTPPSTTGGGWARTPVDRFLAARHAVAGIHPNKVADRRVLIRRAYYALVGLPPAPDEVDAFVADQRPEAYERLIDRLLRSPHFGERQARYWLDLARFAESHGFEQDYDRPYAFHYRDFVIRAFNQDMPYDQFVRWQLAGDELAPDEPLALMATGFLGAGVFPTQLTEKEFERARYDELDDMVSTIGNSMLGLSVGCARCHDHKYDPIPSRDYYEMVATFATTIRSEIDVRLDPEGDRAAMRKYEAEHARLIADRTAYENTRLATGLAEWLRTRPKPLEPGWEVLPVKSATSLGGATLAAQPDGSLLASGKNPKFDTYVLVATTDSERLTAVRIEALPDPSMKRAGPGRADNGNFCLTNLVVKAAPRHGTAGATAVPLGATRADFEQDRLPVTNVIDGDRKTGWAIDPRFGKRHAAVFEFAKPVGFPGGTVLTFELDFQCNTRHNIGRVRLSVTSAARPVAIELGGPPAPILRMLDKPKPQWTAHETEALLAWFKTQDPGWRELDAKVAAHHPPKSSVTKVMVCSEGVKPLKHHADARGFPHFYPQTYYLRRGDPDKKIGVAKSSFLEVLMRSRVGASYWQAPPPEGARTSYRRAAMARWITDVDYGAGALLARVIVNRLWQDYFGTGIVASSSNFGKRGDLPTHPDLLEWLAGELIRNGWRLKPIHKLLVTSAAYMQSSAADPKRLAKDPNNALLWRYTPRRLEAEVIRDAMLSVSGQLDPRMFGKGTLDPAQKRRSIYFMIKRSKLIPMLVTFDLPEPLVCQGRRASTTVAPQALFLLNNEQVRGYAAAFAARVASASDPVTAAYRMALARAPTGEEHADAIQFLHAQTHDYGQSHPADASRLALTDLCQTLFCLNEFVYVD